MSEQEAQEIVVSAEKKIKDFLIVIDTLTNFIKKKDMQIYNLNIALKKANRKIEKLTDNTY